MKTRIILSGLVAVLFVGCATDGPDKFMLIENGFGYGSHVRKFAADSVSWSGLQYQNTNGTRTDVWPYLSLASPAVQITNNLTVLVGGKAELYDDGKERLRDRLIAFEAPIGPPLDITDQVLQKYCAKSGVDFTNVVKDSFAWIKKSNNELQIAFIILNREERGPGTITSHGTTMTISWHDIEVIMQDVKKAGKLKKEKWSGTEYLQKD